MEIQELVSRRRNSGIRSFWQYTEMIDSKPSGSHVMSLYCSHRGYIHKSLLGVAYMRYDLIQSFLANKCLLSVRLEEGLCLWAIALLLITRWIGRYI